MRVFVCVCELVCVCVSAHVRVCCSERQIRLKQTESSLLDIRGVFVNVGVCCVCVSYRYSICRFSFLQIPVIFQFEKSRGGGRG